MRMYYRELTILTIVLLLPVLGNAVPGRSDGLSEWIQRQQPIAVSKMLENISPPGSAAGAVIASPSKSNPNYFRHWVRDAGLTMNLVVSLYQDDPGARAKYFAMMQDYVAFSRRNQTTPNPSGGLGEPLFEADGTPFNQGWGRPQNDSPAIRAIVLTRWAHVLLDEGKEREVREKIYDGALPAHTVLKADLEYVSHHWRESCFDLWEEVKGHHFYTRMVQRKALIDGAALAYRMGDGGAGDWYREQAARLSDVIGQHFSQQKGFIQSTLDYESGVDYKHSNLDASVILGVLHGDTYDSFFPVQDERVLASAQRLMDTFRDLYPINRSGPGVAIGRYPEDHYDGNGFSEGNPWFLLTSAFAEYHYRVARGLGRQPEWAITATNLAFFRSLLPGDSRIAIGTKCQRGQPLFSDLLRAITRRGDHFMDRTRRHAAHDGSLSEQMSRHHGYMQGARDLTWSHAAFLVASWERGAR